MRKKSNNNQLSIHSFFNSQPRKPSNGLKYEPLSASKSASVPISSAMAASKAPTLIDDNEDDDEVLFVSERSVQDDIQAKIISVASRSDVASRKSTVEWWKTPPKGLNSLDRRRTNDSQVTGSPPAKKQNSGMWEGRLKPLVRPGGLASGGSSTNSADISKYQQKFSLSAEQAHIFDLIINKNENVFFSGAAGTGKSHLLRAVISHLRRNRVASNVSQVMKDLRQGIAITAMTGLAAFNIGGQTIHRWSGLVNSSTSVKATVAKIKKISQLKANWSKCKILIIDEVSMMSPEYLDNIEMVARAVRGDSRPFGGIQVVLTGDFYQLPPVYRTEPTARSLQQLQQERLQFPEMAGFSNKKGIPSLTLCFGAQCWTSLVKNHFLLEKVFRQKESRLINMLNAMRTGKITDEIDAQFKELARPVEYNDGLEPTQLYPLRSQVDGANSRKMAMLPGRIFEFKASDVHRFEHETKMLEQLMAPKFLQLKINAQVLLIRNLSDELVNGSRGRVVTFMTESDFMILWSFMKRTPRALELYNECLNTVENGVKISPELLNAIETDIVFPDADTKQIYVESLRSDKEKYPLVDFQTGNESLITPVQFSVDTSNDVSRTQVPLILSWALSIHKSQGQSLDRLVVDLGRVFEAGQAYVAVSRATSYDRLQIMAYNRQSIRVHPEVARFYQETEWNKF